MQKGYSTLSKAISFGWLGLVVIMLIATPRNSQQRNTTATLSSSTSTTSAVSTPSESPKEAALRQAKIDFSWGKGGFGSVMEVDFTIQNPSNYTIKDIEVTCTHFANSGTEIDSNTRTIYESVPAKGKKIIKDFNMGFIHSQANKTSCAIEDLEVVQ